MDFELDPLIIIPVQSLILDLIVNLGTVLFKLAETLLIQPSQGAVVQAHYIGCSLAAEEKGEFAEEGTLLNLPAS